MVCVLWDRPCRETASLVIYHSEHLIFGPYNVCVDNAGEDRLWMGFIGGGEGLHLPLPWNEGCKESILWYHILAPGPGLLLLPGIVRLINPPFELSPDFSFMWGNSTLEKQVFCH